MIRKFCVATLLLCGLALAQAQPAPGNPPEPPRGGPHGHFGPHPDGEGMILPRGRWWKDAEIVKSISLNDTQVQKIEQIFQDSRMKLVDIHANLQKEEIKLEPLLEADNPDEAAVLSAIDRIAASRANLEKANAQMAFAIRRVLSPEQWKKLRTMRPGRDHFPPPMGGPRVGMMQPPPHPGAAAADQQPPVPPQPGSEADDAAPDMK